ncbi:MAG: hypothetical protein H7Y36_02000 [Armatimonadetes bacterium]|nr:hypothetical protein [Akkermansiaceae bacterium]
MTRKWIKKAILVAVSLAITVPLLAYGLSNLYLLSPKGREWIAGKIQQRISLETSVRGATWSPWNGVTLYGLQVRQAEPLREAIKSPLLSVKEIRVMPTWRALIRRQLLIKNINIQQPSLTIPIELLSQIPTKQPDPSLAVKPPELAVKPPDLAMVSPKSEKLAPPPSGGHTAPLPKPQQASPSQPEAPVARIESLPENPQPTIWIDISDARLKIVSTLTRSPLYQISKLDGKLPIGGKNAESSLTLRNIKSFGSLLAGKMKIPIEWKTPVLKFGALDGGFFGLDCVMEAQFALTPNIPFQISSAIPTQKDKEISFGELLHAKLGSVAAGGLLKGLLLIPGSWQGRFAAQSSDIASRYTDQEGRFEQGRALVIFQNGALSCVDARLTGESLSILGNATLISDGRAAANARIVGPPETLAAISKHTRPDDSAPKLTFLSTPQRAALDLKIFGRLGEFYYQPDPGYAPILLK